MISRYRKNRASQIDKLKYTYTKTYNNKNGNKGSEKNKENYEGTSIRLSADFSTERLQAIKGVTRYIQSPEEDYNLE